MNIQRRIEKLETQIMPPASGRSEIEELESRLPNTTDVDEYFAICSQIQAIRQFECTHSPGAFHVRKDYPFPMIEGYPHRLVIKAHCDGCAFDAPLWDVSHITPDQWEKLCNEDRQEGEYSRWLIANGYLNYVPWTQELADHYNAVGGGNCNLRPVGEVRNEHQ